MGAAAAAMRLGKPEPRYAPSPVRYTGGQPSDEVSSDSGSEPRGPPVTPIHLVAAATAPASAADAEQQAASEGDPIQPQEVRTGYMLKRGPGKGDKDKGESLQRALSKAAVSLMGRVRKHGDYKRRYFVLAGPSLMYYKTDRREKMLGAIDISQLERVGPSERGDAPELALDLTTPHRVFTLVPESMEDSMAWVAAFNAQLVQNSRERKRAKTLARDVLAEARRVRRERSVSPNPSAEPGRGAMSARRLLRRLSRAADDANAPSHEATRMATSMSASPSASRGMIASAVARMSRRAGRAEAKSTALSPGNGGASLLDSDAVAEAALVGPPLAVLWDGSTAAGGASGGSAGEGVVATLPTVRSRLASVMFTLPVADEHDERSDITRWEELTGNTPRWALSHFSAARLGNVPLLAPALPRDVVPLAPEVGLASTGTALLATIKLKRAVIARRKRKAAGSDEEPTDPSRGGEAAAAANRPQAETTPAPDAREPGRASLKQTTRAPSITPSRRDSAWTTLAGNPEAAPNRRWSGSKKTAAIAGSNGAVMARVHAARQRQLDANREVHLRAGSVLQGVGTVLAQERSQEAGMSWGTEWASVETSRGAEAVDALEKALRHLVVLNLPAGTTFCVAGEPPTACWLLLHGTVRVSSPRAGRPRGGARRHSTMPAARGGAATEHDSGDWVEVNAREAPLLLEVDAFCNGTPYLSTATTTSGCFVAALSLHAFHSLLSTLPSAAAGIGVAASLSRPEELLSCVPCVAAAFVQAHNRYKVAHRAAQPLTAAAGAAQPGVSFWRGGEAGARRAADAPAGNHLRGMDTYRRKERSDSARVGKAVGKGSERAAAQLRRRRAPTVPLTPAQHQQPEAWKPRRAETALLVSERSTPAEPELKPAIHRLAVTEVPLVLPPARAPVRSAEDIEAASRAVQERIEEARERAKSRTLSGEDAKELELALAGVKEGHYALSVAAVDAARTKRLQQASAASAPAPFAVPREQIAAAALSVDAAVEQRRRRASMSVAVAPASAEQRSRERAVRVAEVDGQRASRAAAAPDGRTQGHDAAGHTDAPSTAQARTRAASEGDADDDDSAESAGVEANATDDTEADTTEADATEADTTEADATEADATDDSEEAGVVDGGADGVDVERATAPPAPEAPAAAAAAESPQQLGLKSQADSTADDAPKTAAEVRRERLARISRLRANRAASANPDGAGQASAAAAARAHASPGAPANAAVAARASATAGARRASAAYAASTAQLLADNERWRVQRVLSSVFRVVTLRAGTVLFRQLDSGDSAYVVVSGQVLCSSRRHDGVGIPIVTLHRGACLGESALLEPHTRRYKATAQTACVLLQMGHARLQSALNGYDTMTWALRRSLAWRQPEALSKVPLLAALTASDPAAFKLLGILSDLFVVSLLCGDPAVCGHADRAGAAEASAGGTGGGSGAAWRGAQSRLLAPAPVSGVLSSAPLVLDPASWTPPVSAQSPLSGEPKSERWGRDVGERCTPVATMSASPGAERGDAPAVAARASSAAQQAPRARASRRAPAQVDGAVPAAEAPAATAAVPHLAGDELDCLILVAAGEARLEPADAAEYRERVVGPGDWVGGTSLFRLHHRKQAARLSPASCDSCVVCYVLPASTLEAWVQLMEAGSSRLRAWKNGVTC